MLISRPKTIAASNELVHVLQIIVKGRQTEEQYIYVLYVVSDLHLVYMQIIDNGIKYCNL